MPRFHRALISVLLVAFLALGVAQPAAALVHTEAQPRLALAGAALDGVALAAPSQAEPGPTVRQSFDLLMRYFVIPPESSTVLNGGLDGLEKLLAARGIGHALAERPAWTNDPTRDWRLFLGAFDAVAQKAGGAVSATDLDRAAIVGMTEVMDEGHTYYMTPEEFRQVRNQLSNRDSFVGIGFVMDPELVVIEVIENSPAQSVGLQVGDRVIAVNGQPVEGMPPAEVSPLVRGEAGTSVTLTVRREGRADPLSVTATRAAISIDWVQSRILPGNIGYLRLRSFPTSSDAMRSLNRAMDRFREAQVEGIVLDLRNNAGGSVDTGQEVAALFMPSGAPLYQQVDRRGGARTVTTWGEPWKPGLPLAVLTNEGSGSMSEILAGALQETGSAKVFGTKTAGVVSGTNYHPLSDGAGLSVTSLLIKTGQGRNLDREGLQPDEVIELDREGIRRGRDNQLDAATAYVRQQMAARAAGVR